MRKNDFYENAVLVDDFEFTIVDQASASGGEPVGRPPVKTKLLMVASAIAVAGVLVFGPWSPENVNPTPGSPTVRVYVRNAWDAGGGEEVRVPAAHYRAAERFRQLFQEAPLTAAEKLPDPDFGL